MQEFNDFVVWVIFPILMLIFMLIGILALTVMFFHLMKNVILDKAFYKNAMEVLDHIKYERTLEKREMDINFQLIFKQNAKQDATCTDIKNFIEANHLNPNKEKNKLPPKKKE